MQQKELQALVKLGEVMRRIGYSESYDTSLTISESSFEQLLQVVKRQSHYNGWFTEESVKLSLVAHGEMLKEEVLRDFMSSYLPVKEAKKVLVIMAGNLPLVGFHDFLCVLMSGNKIIAKLATEDQQLLPALVHILFEIEESFKEKIQISAGLIKDSEAVIATGSDNSTKYFEQYFGQKPHIFRKNRTSVAILDGTETKDDFQGLGTDIFQYFGLGCRNVSHLLLPKGYDLGKFFEGIFDFGSIVNHHKYANNYDYNKAVHLLNQIPLLENGFLLIKESNDLHSPLAMLNYHYYENQVDIDSYLEENKEAIQVVVGKNYVPFGQAQQPTISDFADNVDTMRFLTSL